MTVRALLIAAPIFFFGWPLGAASAAPSHLWGPASPALTVRAGVGGAARPGRWLPVDVAIIGGDTPLTATLSVEWGGAVARRDVQLAASSTARVTLLVRTIAASPGVRVTLAAPDGTVTASTDAPLTLMPVDETLRLCIGDVAASTECSISIPEAEAPTNARAMDLADVVEWHQSGAKPPRESARAFALWQATRWWQDSGSVDPVVKPFDNISRLTDRTARSLALFVAGLLVATLAGAWRRAPALLLLGIPVAMAAAGVALVTQSSRDVDIQASSFVHQFAGVSQSTVLMKGEVEHPGPDAITLTPAISDASLDIAHGLQNTESVSTIDGQAVYRNTAGRGARARFDLSGSLDQEWLAVSSGTNELTIENRAPFALVACEVRATDAFVIGTIAPGATARTTRLPALAPGDAIVCTLPPNWLDWSAPAAAVRTRGSAFLIFHAWPGAAAPAESHGTR